MHRIRLREPWSARLDRESGAVVYSRKFHKPTGIEQQSIRLRISIVPSTASLEAPVVVLVNEVELRAEVEMQEALIYRLDDLSPFNTLEFRIFGLNTITGPSSDTPAIPTFGSFVIESVELQIE